ncbi:hypothetical protein BKG69_01090 [Mycobacteroides chelonae]|nr:hypothetical protein [Mycobacteroides chelonae]OHT82238.1 hypothetical protein BKG69_01090 [Mycobacteroides chelonae]
MGGDESASSLALEVIDELRVRMLECLLVLQTLPDEADLNFDELAHELLAAHRSARQAFEAASLLHQGAALDERWGSGCSRPRAIYARHNAAVRRGAEQVRPAAALSDTLERRLWQLPSTDRTQDVVGARPTCSGTVRTTGQECSTTAIYLGQGMFGSHCYVHASAGERQQYRAHHDTVSTRQATSREQLQDLQRTVGEHIAAHWIADREDRQRWIDQMAQIADRRQ